MYSKPSDLFLKSKFVSNLAANSRNVLVLCVNVNVDIVNHPVISQHSGVLHGNIYSEVHYFLYEFAHCTFGLCQWLMYLMQDEFAC